VELACWPDEDVVYVDVRRLAYSEHDSAGNIVSL
jgi:hypothetical protein